MQGWTFGGYNSIYKKQMRSNLNKYMPPHKHTHREREKERERRGGGGREREKYTHNYDKIHINIPTKL